MPFIPHTKAELESMLTTIGVDSLEQLFDEIPKSLISSGIDEVPETINEMNISKLMHARARSDGQYVNFIGAGVYEHHIPAAVWELTTRGEFYSAYTPYQAEASQGTLQLIYEYQSMITALTGMDVTNASLYDGASALAEAVLMAIRSKKKANRILVPGNTHPFYKEVAHNIIKNQNIFLDEVPFEKATGKITLESLKQASIEGVGALVICQPNFFGGLEDVDQLTNWAHENDLLVIAVVNPTSLALLTPPGAWGETGADIVVGEGQPMGIPMSSGGPYFGFMCSREKLMRQMPGRIIGRTVDLEGKQGFSLTLQAREQHIRRSKATSNICTNQGLMVTAATIYMSLLGPDGLANVAKQCHGNTLKLVQALTKIEGVQQVFDGPVFHEALLQLNTPVADVLSALQAQGIVGGYDVSGHFPELGNAMLVCATEVRTDEEIENYALHLEQIMSKDKIDSPRAVKVNQT
jgi:glycine dehydrogenase subunit 1